MRPVAITFVVLAMALVSRTGADETPKRSAELQVLDRYIGNWETVCTLKSTGEKFGSRESRRWSKEGTFVLSEDVNLSTKKEAHFLITYDANARVYRSCFIQEGNAVILLGTWDKDTRTMKWNSTDADGVKSAGENRFIDADHAEWSMVVTDRDGKVLMEMSAKQARRK